MAYRVLENIEEKMILAILTVGGREGVQKVSAQKIADICGISTFTVFEHFKNKRGFLDAAAEYFDKQHIAEVFDMVHSGKNLDYVWDKMLDSFVSDPDGSLYYISYTNTFGFDPTSKNPRADEFLNAVRVLIKPSRELTDDQYLIIWDYITSMAFYYAEKFIHNYLPYDDSTRKFITEVVFKGLDSVL